MRKVVIIFTAVFLILFATNAIPALRGAAGWEWLYQLPTNWTPVIILALLLVLYCVGAWFLRGQRRFIALGWCVIGGATLGFVVTGVRGDPFQLLFTHTVAPVQTGYSTVAVNVMARDGADATLTHWTDVMHDALTGDLIHITTSPPGQVLAHYWTAQLFEGLPASWSMTLRPYQCSNLNVMRYTRGELLSAGFWGMLMPLWSALAAIPIYFAAREMSDKTTALRLAQWWALVPSALLFLPTWNTFYPFLVTCAFALLLQGLHRNSRVHVLAAGVVISITTFMNFSVLPALLLFGLFTLGFTFFVAHRSLLWAVINGVLFGLGLSVIWLIFWLASGYTPLDIFGVTLGAHGELAMRPYLAWLLLHPYDVLMFSGWALTSLFLWGIFTAIRSQSLRLSGSKIVFSASDVLALSMLLTLLLIDFSGIVRGENARILIFYVPFLLLSAVRPLSQTARNWDIPLLITQAVTVLVMATVLYTIPSMLNPPPTDPRVDIPRPLPSETHVSGAIFTETNYSGRFRLIEYRFIADPAAQAITLELSWSGIAPTERPYQFLVFAAGTNILDGEVISEPLQWYPQHDNYLTTCWRSGQVIRDTVILNLPPVSEPLQWDLWLNVVDDRTGKTMEISLADGSPVGSLLLGPVSYP
jgi:hypothetical protein